MQTFLESTKMDEEDSIKASDIAVKQILFRKTLCACPAVRLNLERRIEDKKNHEWQNKS